jgi:glucose/arabinose dehydrogenase
MRPYSFALLATLTLAACTPAGAQVIQSEEQSFTVETVASGLAHPWGIAFLPNGDALVTERPGRIRIIRNGALQDAPIEGGPEVRASGQGGLLDIALHPQFAENQYVYITYSKPGEAGAATALARARFDGQRLTGLEDLFVADNWNNRGQHFGSRIVFDGNGMVFISAGERGERDRAQDPSDHAGTIIRLHDDGRVPQDNPFVGREGFRAEIYSYGHRNPQGMVRHPETGELWATEHGARGGDEINLVMPGRNYGWPAITHGINYNGQPITPDTARAGMEQPVLHWTPSIATSGLTFYTGDAFPNWKGNLFAGALAGQHVRRVVLNGNRVTHQEVLLEGRGRIRTVKEAPDGSIYLLVDAANGDVLRIAPARD